ncbi:MAG: response regulator transcription factor [Treponema sp.]|jgi:DNA-binding NarL/FixJ family response regulator|nr:response regulator transcription factor [Treponema sp.]
MSDTTVLIVDDHPLFSKGLSFLINSQSSYAVIGEAQNRAEAMELLRNEKPSLAIVDLNLGNEEGLDLIKDMKSYNPDIVILVLSMHDERYYAERVLRAGAKGYIMKHETGTKVIAAIKTVMSGKVYLSEAERELLFEYMAGDTFKEGKDRLSSIQKLSDRQFQIFNLIGKGLGTVEIASKLNISPKTIDTHKEHIKLKLHCNSSQELRQFAVEWMGKLPV